MLFVNLFFSFENNFATEYASLNAAYLKLYLLSWFVEERDVHAPSPFGFSTYTYSMKLKLVPAIALDKKKR